MGDESYYYDDNYDSSESCVTETLLDSDTALIDEPDEIPIGAGDECYFDVDRTDATD